MKVICDTNVWYNINPKKIPSNLKEYELWGTIESVEELSMTTNLFSNLARTLEAIKSLHSNTKGIIKFTPGEYILFLGCGYVPKKHMGDMMIAHSKDIIKTDVYEMIQNRKYHNDEIEKAIKEHRSQLEEIAKIFNDYAQTKKIKDKNSRKAHWAANLIQERKQIIIITFENWRKEVNIQVKVNWSRFPWEKVSFFLNVFDTFLKSVEVGTRKFKSNDLIDLFNMIYVTPNSKYLTYDKKWHNLIRESAPELEEFLVQSI